MMHPHSNRDIIASLQTLRVKRLHWRKVDLGMKTLKVIATEVEHLTLYSSGDFDTLAHWVSHDGLCQLTKVEKT